MSPVWIILGVVAVGAVTSYLSYRMEKKRTEGLKRVADEMGFTFSDKDTGALLSDLGGFHLFSHGHSQSVWNILQGEAFSLGVILFDYKYTVGSGKNRRTTTQTVLCFRLPEGELPKFTLRPESFFHKIGQVFGYQDIDFDSHPKFSRRYLLRGNDEAAVRMLFTPEILEFFESQDGLSVEGAGGMLLYYRHDRRIDPDGVRSFLEDGFKCMNLFQQSGAGTGGEGQPAGEPT